MRVRCSQAFRLLSESGSPDLTISWVIHQIRRQKNEMGKSKKEKRNHLTPTMEERIKPRKMSRPQIENEPMAFSLKLAL